MGILRTLKRKQTIGEQRIEDFERNLDALLTYQSSTKALKMLTEQGVVNRQGNPLTQVTFDYQCTYAFLSDPDKWRKRLAEIDIRNGYKPMNDDEWNRHVVENCVRFVKSSRYLVFKLLRNDPKRWGKYRDMWANHSWFDTLELPE